MRVASDSAMIAKIRRDVFAQRGKSRDARSLVMQKIAPLAAQCTSAHAIPREQRKQPHIRLTRPEWPRRGEMNQERARSRGDLFCGTSGLTRHRDGTAHEDSRARRG